jgi:hypothetical protein
VYFRPRMMIGGSSVELDNTGVDGELINAIVGELILEGVGGVSEGVGIWWV